MVNGRQQIKDAEYPRLPAKERHARLAQMIDQARQKEDESKLASLSDLDRVKDAAQYLRAVKEVCTSKTRDEVIKARRIVNEFANWLEASHNGITLDKINTAIAIEYAKWLKAGGKTANNPEPIILSNETIKSYLVRLGYIFRRVVKAMEDSQIKYRNGFEDANSLLEYLPKEEKFKRDIYTVRQYKKLFMLMMSPTSKSGLTIDTTKAFKYIAATYFTLVTGWRIGNIIYKKWEDVDFVEKTIFNLHNKTKKTSGSRTKVKLTDNAVAILKRLKSLSGDSPYIFSFTDEQEPEKSRNWYEAYYDFFTRRVKAMGGNKEIQRGSNSTRSTLTPHSMRSTAISALKAANVANDSIITAYVGHSSNSNEVERRYYDKFSPSDYTPCMAYLEAHFVPEWLFSLDEVSILKRYRHFTLIQYMAAIVSQKYAGEDTELAAAIQQIYKDKHAAIEGDMLLIPTLERIAKVMNLEGMADQLEYIKIGVAKLVKDMDRLNANSTEAIERADAELALIGMGERDVLQVAKKRIKAARTDRMNLYGSTLRLGDIGRSVPLIES